MEKFNPHKKTFTTIWAYTTLYTSLNTILRKLYAKIEKNPSGSFWENELLNWNLFFKNSKLKILQKRIKGLEIFTQGIFPPIFKKIRKLVAELQVLTDGPTDRRRATAIGPVDLTTLQAFQPNPPYHMLSSQRSFMKKKEKKLLDSFWEN